MSKETFKTTDLYVAAYLKSKKVKIIGSEMDGSRVYIIFEGKDLWDMANEYYNNEAVLVSDYVKAVQDIKSIIFDTERNEDKE